MREALPTVGSFSGPGHVGTGARRVGLIERYAEHMPLEPGDPVVSLNEGSTPLIHLPELSERLECELHVKFEGLNPTGSFKDRGMTVAVSGAVRDGAEAVICASTGNTAASLAAYASRAGIRGIVLVPDGKIAMGKLAQALMHGAQVLALRGNFDEALRLVRELTKKHPIALVNSVSPYRIEGQKTAAFEIVEDLGGVPDALAIPVGNAGNITAYWKGFREAVEGWIPATPDPREHGLPVREFVHPDPDAPGGGVRMFGFQAAGANPLVTGVPVPEPDTVATAIRIGNPARWEEAMEAVTTSRGRILDVTDAEILDAYRLLAREGVFCEPASATSVAGLLKHGADGAGRVVAVLTGHGLKDPQTALEQSPPVVPCEPTLDALERRILD